MSGDTSDEPTGIGTSDAPSPPRAGEDERCRLQELPPEIRNDIFALAIVEPTPIKLTVTRFSQQTAIKITRHQYHNQLTGLSLASTCRQFRQEAIQVFYAENTFSLELARFAIRTENTTLKFPLHKATSIVFKAFGEKERDSWTGASVFIEPKLHVEKLADGSLSIRASDVHICDSIMAEDSSNDHTITATNTNTGVSVSPPVQDDQCRLKSIPPEIRNYIFLLAAVESEPITLLVSIPTKQLRRKIEIDETGSCPQLTGLLLARTCRQFHEEVTPVFYA
ncbi:hypothetical protein M409DRAFT_24387 [Zasmidium cellare ATCC 36951]|uniref:2EXR domain-containing protein n=1 Tax=Zasmidium cellare ATCC 36951 TaxID=1080233 RepID=A0A6A6CEA3_ZASCE|nr:uncharacterized protein M409DRAFT_24387 [Zasmidium cellare ATCC 36951]KAF2165534.1 hypothetical protein M409DRAFT_24387 [Zasmidium cellare ATCC 36951]